MFAISQQAQTSLRSIIGQSEMDQLLAERESVNRELRRIIDEPTEGPWGIRVERVEIKDVSLPEGMKRSMSRQAEAERERRARIITADGEYQASKRLAAAANVMSRDPAALQLRLLQTVVEVAGERNSTLVMPIESRPSAAGPPGAIPPVQAIAIPPVQAPDIKFPRSRRTGSRPDGCRRPQGSARPRGRHYEHRERDSARIRVRLARGQARRAPSARLPVRQNIRIWAAGLVTAPDRQRAHKAVLATGTARVVPMVRRLAVPSRRAGHRLNVTPRRGRARR